MAHPVYVCICVCFSWIDNSIFIQIQFSASSTLSRFYVFYTKIDVHYFALLHVYLYTAFQSILMSILFLFNFFFHYIIFQMSFCQFWACKNSVSTLKITSEMTIAIFITITTSYFVDLCYYHFLLLIILFYDIFLKLHDLKKSILF